MKHFYDIETREVISERDLQDEFINLQIAEPSKYKSFENYIKNCLTINNGTLLYIGKKANYKTELHQCITEDNVWRDYYKRHYKGKAKFPHIVKDLVNYVFDSEYNPYLEHRYVDISWLEVDNNVYINLDDIWEMFCERVREN